MDFVSTGILPQGTVSSINLAMSSSEVWKEHDVLELALTALSYNLEPEKDLFRQDRNPEVPLREDFGGRRALHVINSMKIQILKHGGRAQEAFKKALIDHVRDFVEAKSEGVETNVSEFMRAPAVHPANMVLAEWSKAKARGISQEEIETYAASFFSAKPSLDLIAYVYTHRVDLGCVDMDLEKFQELLLPPGEGEVEDFLKNWLRAKLKNSPEVGLYGRAFFNTNPSPDLVLQAYRLPLEFLEFGEDLDKYQDILVQLGRVLSHGMLDLDGLSATTILDIWEDFQERCFHRKKSPCKEQEQRFSRAFLNANPTEELVDRIYRSSVNLAYTKRELEKYQEKLTEKAKLPKRESEPPAAFQEMQSQDWVGVSQATTRGESVAKDIQKRELQDWVEI